MARIVEVECDICGQQFTIALLAPLITAECDGCGHMCSVPGAFSEEEIQRRATLAREELGKERSDERF